MTDTPEHLEFDDEIELVSKTQIKREMQALQALGEKLVALRPDQLDKLPLDDTLRNAIDEAARLKSRPAIKRQLQYIGRLMRTADAEGIEKGMARFEAGQAEYNKHFHKLEQWRMRLIDGDNSDVQAFVDQYPAVDVQQLRQKIRNAKKSASKETTSNDSKKLFQFLRGVVENSSE